MPRLVVQRSHRSSILELVALPHEQMATFGSDQQVLVWDLPSRKLVGATAGIGGIVGAVGTSLAVATLEPARTRLFPLEGGEFRAPLPGELVGGEALSRIDGSRPARWLSAGDGHRASYEWFDETRRRRGTLRLPDGFEWKMSYRRVMQTGAAGFAWQVNDGVIFWNERDGVEIGRLSPGFLKLPAEPETEEEKRNGPATRALWGVPETKPNAKKPQGRGRSGLPTPEPEAEPAFARGWGNTELVGFTAGGEYALVTAELQPMMLGAQTEELFLLDAHKQSAKPLSSRTFLLGIHAAVHPTAPLLAVVDGSCVVEVYRSPTLEPVWHFWLGDLGKSKYGDKDTAKMLSMGLSPCTGKALAFSETGRSLVVSSSQSHGASYVFDTDTGRLQGTLGMEQQADADSVYAPVQGAGFTAAGELFLDRRGDLQQWSLATGELRHLPRARDDDDFYELRHHHILLPNGDLIRVTHEDPFVTGNRQSFLIQRWPSNEAPPSVAMHHEDAPQIPAGKLAIWPPPRGASRSAMVTAVRSVDLDMGYVLLERTGRIVTTRVDDGPIPRGPGLIRISVLDLARQTATTLASSRGGGVRVRLATSADESVLANELDTGDAHVFAGATWNPATGELLQRFPLSAPVIAVTFSRNDSLVSFATEDARITTFDLASGKEAARVTARAPCSTLAARSTTGELVCVTSSGDLLILDHGAVVRSAVSPNGPARSLLMAPDGRRAITLGDDGAMHIWDSSSATELAGMLSFPDGESIAWIPTGAFGGTREAATRVAWVYDQPLEAFGLEQFWDQLHRPDLVRQRLSFADVDVKLPASRPPTVSVVSHESDARGNLSLHIRAQSAVKIERFEVFVEGRPVITKTPCAPDIDTTVEVPLLPGRNRVTVMAFDALGYGSNPQTIDVPGPEAGGHPKLWVRSFGINDYPGKLKLGAAAADAQAVAEAFRRQVGPGRPFSDVDSVVLPDSKASVQAIRQSLADLRLMAPQDLAIVFFAGHGVKPTLESDTLLVTDAIRLNKDNSVDRASLGEATIAWSDFAKALGEARGRVLLLLDACHTGHLTQGVLVPDRDTVRHLGERSGLVVFAASTGSQLSYESRGTRGLELEQEAPANVLLPDGATHDHGYFTGAIINALDDAETDRNGDGLVQLSELVDSVTRNVTRATGGRQTPWVVRRELFGDFQTAALQKSPPTIVKTVVH